MITIDLDQKTDRV